jgi:hypothetical protein
MGRLGRTQKTDRARDNKDENLENLRKSSALENKGAAGSRV